MPRILAISSISCSLCLPCTPSICGYFSASSRSLRTVIFSRSLQSIRTSGVNGFGVIAWRDFYHKKHKDTKTERRKRNSQFGDRPQFLKYKKLGSVPELGISNWEF